MQNFKFFNFLLLNRFIMFGKVKKFQIIFVIKRYEMYVIKEIVNVEEVKKVMNIHKKQYIINVKHPTVISKTGKAIYVVDFDTSNQLNYNVIKAPLLKEDIDLMFGQKIIKEIAHSVVQDKKEKILNTLIGVVFGVLCASLIAILLFQRKIDEIYKEMLSKNYVDIIPLYKRW